MIITSRLNLSRNLFGKALNGLMMKGFSARARLFSAIPRADSSSKCRMDCTPLHTSLTNNGTSISPVPLRS